MTSYKIGYGKPPKGKPFKPGQSGNPRGRPPRTKNSLGEIVEGVLDAPMAFREKGQARTSSRREIAIKVQIERAMKGSVEAADLLLKKRAHALKHGPVSSRQLTVVNWLPDYPGQTGEQKARGLDLQFMQATQMPGESEPGEQGPGSEAANKPPQDDEA